MFAFLEGKICHKQDGCLILNVNGVGYELFMSNYSLSALPVIGDETKVFTYLQVKEDGITLFGFATAEEKELFLKLITVSGVGPKMAIGILSNISMNELTQAIALNDIKILSTIKGVGKKTAERIAIELKDKVTLSMSENIPEQIIDSKAVDEAILVLVSLGINKNDALRLAREYAKEDSIAEDIVAKALRGMNS